MRRVPSYRKHASGQATVHIRGKDYYLGLYDSPASHAEYARLIATYVTNGHIPTHPARDVRDAITRWTLKRRAALSPKDRHHFDTVLRIVGELFGQTRLDEFGPVRFQQVRAAFVAKGWCRNHVNRQAARVKEWLAWLVGAELYPEGKLAAVRVVPELRKGEAVESPHRQPVSAFVVGRTVRAAPRPVQGLILAQFYTGARPGEVCILRPCDVNRDGVAVLPDGKRITLPGVWVYVPSVHKGSWADRPRWVLIGPRCQERLAGFLTGDADDFAFRPSDVAKAPNPGPHYQVGSYAQAVKCAARRAGVEHWSPYQLRHRAAQLIRNRFTEEHVREVLGHAPPGITGIYTRQGLLKAAEAIRELG